MRTYESTGGQAAAGTQQTTTHRTPHSGRAARFNHSRRVSSARILLESVRRESSKIAAMAQHSRLGLSPPLRFPALDIPPLHVPAYFFASRTPLEPVVDFSLAWR